MKKRSALIIANGAPPARALARRLAARAGLVVCADGGANHAARLGIRPDAIVGDLDSITEGSKRRFREIPLVRVEDQESTDLEKAIRYLLARGAAAIDVLGATGRRTDHTAGNLGCFRKFRSRCSLRFIDDDGELSLVDRAVSLRTRPGEILSLIPLGRCTGVSTVNLLYGLRNGTLELGRREGTSNRATGARVRISLRKGTLLLYRRHAPRRA